MNNDKTHVILSLLTTVTLILLLYFFRDFFRTVDESQFDHSRWDVRWRHKNDVSNVITQTALAITIVTSYTLFAILKYLKGTISNNQKFIIIITALILSTVISFYITRPLENTEQTHRYYKIAR